MDRETTLDEFLDGQVSAESVEADPESAEADAADGSPSSGDGDVENALDDGTVDDPTSTCRWTPGSEPCPRCGAETRRRWRGPDGLVCAACRGW